MALEKTKKYLAPLISFAVQNLVVVFLLGFLFLFLGRHFPSEIFSLTFYCLSGIFFLTPCLLLLTSQEVNEFYPGRLKKWLWLILAAGFVALLFYLLQIGALWNALFGRELLETLSKTLKGMQKFFQISYLTLLFAVLILSVLFQASLKAIRSEPDKIPDARDVAVNVCILFAILVALNYAARLRPASIDLTTLGKYTLSEESVQMLGGVDQEVTITGFYPFFHNIYREVELMLGSIRSANPLIQFSIANALTEKDLADSKQVDRNGYVVFETLDTNELEIDRRNKKKTIRMERPNDLKKMEKEFVSTIIRLTKKRKKIYFTEGHGEVPSQGEFTGGLLSKFQKELEKQNYDISRLSVRDGFPPEIPEDADLVAVVGAKKIFTRAEQKALKNYLLLRKGSVFLCLDPTLPADFSFLLEPFKIKYKNETLFSEKSGVQGNPNIIIASNYKEHPITSLLFDLVPRHKFSIFPWVGHFEKDESVKKDALPEADYTASYIIKTNPDTWVDTIKNSVHDAKKEPAKARNIALAIQENKPERPFRLVAFGDADFVKNQYIRWPGKHYDLAIHSIQWLLEDANIRGILPKEIQAGAVKLTNKEDNFVFYFLVFIWPFTIILSGIFYLRYKRKSGSLH